MKKLGWAIVVVALVACGGGDAREEAAETKGAEVVERDALVLRVALQSPVAGIDSLLAAWSEREGAEVDFELNPDPLRSAEEFALIELDAVDLGDAAASSLVRAVADWKESAVEHAGYESARYDSQLFALPWRGRVHGLLRPASVDVEEVGTWSELARRAQRAGGVAVLKDADGVTPWAFLSLSVGNGARFDTPELSLDPPPTLEAMAFLARLHGRGSRIEAVSEGAALIESGRLVASVLGAPGVWSPWPASSGSTAVAWVEPRVLCIPRSGPYLDLATSLALELDRWIAAAPASVWRSLRKDHLPDAEYRSLVARPGLRRAVESWSMATAAVLDRRRSPQDALEEAQSRWMTSELHGP